MIGLRLFGDPAGLYRLPKAQQLEVLAALQAEAETSSRPTASPRSRLPSCPPPGVISTMDAWERLRALETG